jgi:hypothetical protein
MTINPQDIISQVVHIVVQVISYGLLALMLAMVAQQFGFRVPYVPALNPQVQIYLFGCWALYRYMRA